MRQSRVNTLFHDQGIDFDAVLSCPHSTDAECGCRKPGLRLVREYLKQPLLWEACAVVGDESRDLALADAMGVVGFQLDPRALSWTHVADRLLSLRRRGQAHRRTRETDVSVTVELDGQGCTNIATGIGFFDHMLEQLGKHSGMDLSVGVRGDLHVDTHHTVEDTALALGQALAEALGNKHGVRRYGFLLPMDESRAQVALDLSGRPYFVWEGELPAPMVGALPTEMVPHFFRSFADALQATLHIQVWGSNTHHMVESCFKAVARALGQATALGGAGLPSTKGTL